LFALQAVLFLIAGCYSPPPDSFATPGVDLPIWPDASAEQALKTIEDRESLVDAIRLQGTLVIVDPESRVRLHAIMLADGLDTQAPRLRLRASKLGSSVMDLVKVGSDAWLWRGDDRQMGARAEASLTKTPPLQLRGYTLRLERTTADYFVFRASWPGDSRPAQAWVHRPTRLLHRVVYSTGDEPVTLSLRYIVSDSEPTLDALQITAPGSRTITYVVESSETNPTLTDAHFKPLPDSKLIKSQAKP
jgi:hypothetical protein